jgi:RES domain-containing protein
MDLWRISKFASLSGEGGRLYAARWNSAGEPIVYLAASPPGALLEALVHLELEDDEIPPSYTLLRIRVPDALAKPALTPPPGKAWLADPSVTRKLGDTWLGSARSALVRVPSSIMPHTFNYLLNPRHRDAARVKIVETLQAVYDPRLLHKPR